LTTSVLYTLQHHLLYLKKIAHALLLPIILYQLLKFVKGTNTKVAFSICQHTKNGILKYKIPQ